MASSIRFKKNRYPFKIVFLYGCILEQYYIGNEKKTKQITFKSKWERLQFDDTI